MWERSLKMQTKGESREFSKHVESLRWSEREGLSVFEGKSLQALSGVLSPKPGLSWLLSPGTPSVVRWKISSLILEVLMFGEGTVSGGKAEPAGLIVACQ